MIEMKACCSTADCSSAMYRRVSSDSSDVTIVVLLGPFYRLPRPLIVVLEGPPQGFGDYSAAAASVIMPNVVQKFP